MNNKQKRLFNIANRIEKLMYENGCTQLSKTVNHWSIRISLGNLPLTHNFIEPLVEITKKIQC